MKRAILAVCLSIVFTQISLAYAQKVTGNIEGRVLDDKGEPVAFANVVVSGPALQGSRGVMTTSEGYFAIPNLPPGTYTVKISHVTYQMLTMNNVVVRLGKTITLSGIALTPTVFEAPEVVVTDTHPPLDVTVTELGGNITAEELERLPTLRDYRSAIAYLPQANTSFLGDATNIAGSSGSENAYYIDGVNVTDPYAGEGLQSTRLPQNFIKELQLISAGYQAEYGRSSGGIVNVVTQSGSNEFKGSVFGFYTNNEFTSEGQRGPVALDLVDFARYDLGVTLSGPIARDKLWYFAAYNPTVRRENLVIPGFGEHLDERIIHQFAGKLTWRASQKTNLNLVVFGDPSVHDRVGPNLFGATPSVGLVNVDPFLGKWQSGGTTISLEGQHLFSDNFLLDLNVYRFDTRQKAEPATEIGWNEPQLTDATTGLWSGGYQNIFDNHSVRTSARLVATGYAKTHEIKLGLEYEDNELETLWQWRTPDGFDGWVSQFPDTSAPLGSLWESSNWNQDMTIHVRVPSFFIQDSWQASSRLRLNVGVRWDGYYSIDEKGDVVEEINDQYQPRLGFVYQLGELGSQKIFASAGRFYEQVPSMAGRFLSGFYQHSFIYTENPINNPTAVPADTAFIIAGGVTDLPAEDLKGQHFDEFTLGYERRIGNTWRAGIAGIHRELREVVDDAVEGGVLGGLWQRGNPGRGALDFLPDPIRRYTALELTLGTTRQRYNLGTSYVLSRSYGNYVGVYNTDQNVSNANTGPAFTTPLLLKDAEGLLPNDRTHVFKLFGSYATSWGLGAGAFFTWQSGTPLSEFGLLNYFYMIHQVPRGTAGRTASIWDLNLRFSYDLVPRSAGRKFSSRLLLDVFHFLSEKTPVNFDQTHYFGVDANGDPNPAAGTNPFYLQPTAWQPPMVIRMGIETGF